MLRLSIMIQSYALVNNVFKQYLSNLTTILILGFLLCAPLTSKAFGNYEFLKSSNRSEKELFSMLMDSLYKYNSRNDSTLQEGIYNGLDFLQNSSRLDNNDIIRFAVIRAHQFHKTGDILECYKMLSAYSDLSKKEEISTIAQKNFNYIYRFTLITIGDYKEAQALSYKSLAKAKEEKDTTTVIRNLMILSQIYGDQGEYKLAEQHLSTLYSNKFHYKVQPNTQCLIDYELSEVYIETKQYQKANEIIDQALIYLEQNEQQFLRPDFIYLKGTIALRNNKMKLAQQMADDLEESAKGSQDPIIIKNSLKLSCELLTKQQKYTEALNFYKIYLDQTTDLETSVKSEIHGKIHKIYHLVGNDTKAYEHLLISDNLLKIANEKKKAQETVYLQIKFQTEEKEKENQELAIEVLKNQNKAKTQQVIISFFFISILFLFGAFAQKRRYNHKLAIKVEQKTKELADNNSELIKTNKELDQFNRILSHDLQEPLRSIVSFSDLIIKEKTENNNVNEYIGYIRRSGNQLSQIVKDVLRYQKIKSKYEEAPRPINFNKMIGGMKEVISKNNSELDLKLFFTKLPEFQSNYSIVQETFWQLIQNSIKFNQSNRVEIKFSYFEKEKEHIFLLQDNGIGIPKDFHLEIFEMFKRLHDRAKYEGTGLGLSIVKRMLQKIGGDISVLQSEVNKGTLFEIRLPKLQNDNIQNFNNEKVKTVIY